MMTMLALLYTAIASSEFLLFVTSFSCVVKLYFLGILIPRGLRSSRILTPWILLLCVLIGSLIGDVSWFFKLAREIWHVPTDYTTVTFVIRIGWAFMIMQFQALALFIESLPESTFTLKRRHFVSLAISGSLVCFFLYLAFFSNVLLNEAVREQAKRTIGSSTPLEIAVMRYVAFYLLYVLLTPSLICTIIKMRRSDFPKILYSQMRVFLQYLMAPYIFSEFIQTIIILFHVKQPYLYPLVSLSTLMLIYAVYYCIQRVMSLRFLNFSTRVQDRTRFNFIDDFKTILEQLSYVTTLHELNHLSQVFFKEAFDIPLRKATLHLRKDPTPLTHEPVHEERDKLELLVEQSFEEYGPALSESILNAKILIRDEIVFNNFYDADASKKMLLLFLDTIHADIFIPLHEKNTLVGYIIVERHARSSKLYSNIESDEMLVLANYINNIINLIRKRNLEELLKKEKELKDELYQKHQEINQYKESIQTFLHTNLPKKIGVIFYKNRHFTFGNQIAKELVNIDINKDIGHPTSQALLHIARLVEEYKAPQIAYGKDSAGNELVLNGVPNIEHNNIIITLYYPSISDIVARRIDNLKNPTQWDYLLYLETTELGKQINALIPSHTQTLLQCKIELFQAAINKRSLLLDVPEDDVMSFVAILHPKNLQETVHSIQLHAPEHAHEVALKLFGLHHPLSDESAHESLLKKVGSGGTIVIRNVHFLHLDTQEHLAELMAYGLYREIRGKQKKSCSARIICTTNYNLPLAVHEGSFSKNLWHELKKNTFTMPSLLTLHDYEFNELVSALVDKTIREDTFKHVLQLSDRDRAALLVKRPISLADMHKKIVQLMINNSKKHSLNINETVHVLPAITDPEIIEAARLGKHALRDPKIMSKLWATFKNQNLIASFLNVNRSSVNRRCKEYNLE